MGARRAGKKDPPFCTIARFLVFQLDDFRFINLRNTILCLFSFFFSESLNLTTPCKTFNAHSHMHLTSDLSAVRSMAERCLSSQCERAPKTAKCFLENFLVQGEQRLEFIRVAPAIVISRLGRRLARLTYLFLFFSSFPAPLLCFSM